MMSFVCEICGRQFFTKKALSIHKGLAHNPYRAKPVRRSIPLQKTAVKLADAYFYGLKELSRKRRKSVSYLIREAVADLIVSELPIHANNNPGEAGE